MSDTPRTDGEETFTTYPSSTSNSATKWVRKDFARQLERELAAANARVEALKADRDKLLVMASRMADCINRCQDEDDCSDLSAAYDFRQEYPR